jgi:hypothetical protein
MLVPQPSDQSTPEPEEAAATLADLVRRIKDDLITGQSAAYIRVVRYRAVGQNLIKAKKLVGHGNWIAWLKENFDLCDRRASTYMKFARKSENVSDLEELESIWYGLRRREKKPEPPTTSTAVQGTGNGTTTTGNGQGQPDGEPTGPLPPPDPTRDPSRDPKNVQLTIEKGQHKRWVELVDFAKKHFNKPAGDAVLMALEEWLTGVGERGMEELTARLVAALPNSSPALAAGTADE